MSRRILSALLALWMLLPSVCDPVGAALYGRSISAFADETDALTDTELFAEPTPNEPEEPELAVDPAQEPTALPSIEPSAEPLPDVTPEPDVELLPDVTPEPDVVLLPDVTPEPDAELLPEATPEPPSDPPIEQTVEPTVEPSREPAAAALAATVIAPATLTVGKTARWNTRVSGAVGAITIEYTIIMNNEPLEEYPATAETLFEYAPRVPASFVVRARVTDESGAQTVAQSKALAAAYETTPDDWKWIGVSEGGDIFHNGEGLVSRGFAGDTDGLSANEERALLAYLRELQVAYLVMDTGLINPGKKTTWTAKVAGGDGKYTYRYHLLKVTKSSNGMVYGNTVKLSSYTSSSIFAYAPSYNQYGYWVRLYVKDERGNYVVYDSDTYYCQRAGDEYNMDTVAGRVRWVIDNYITSGMSQESKARALHDYVARSSQYDEFDGDYLASANPSGVMLVGRGVCASYAEAYRLLCLAAGLECIVVHGQAFSGGRWGAHAWNLVKIEGKWYHVDTLWDDNDTNSPGSVYWMKKDADLPSDHWWDKDALDDRYIDGLLPTGATTPDTIHATTEITLNITQSRELVVDHSPADAPAPAYTFKSSGSSIAAVDVNGVVTGLKKGTVTITVSTPGGLKAKTKVTVKDSFAPKSVMLNMTGAAPFNMGSTISLTAEPNSPDALTFYKWSTSSKKIVSLVSADGRRAQFRAEKEGTATLKVTTHNGKTASVKIKVVDPKKPTAVKLTEASPIVMTIGEKRTQPLSYALEPSTAVSSVIWSSSNSAVASVNKDTGLITAKKAGTATIKVKTKIAGKTSSIKVKVIKGN